MRLPDSGAETLRWLTSVLVVGLIVVVAVYAVQTLLAVGVLIAIIVVALFVGYVIGGRLWDWARHGKPLLRGRMRGGEISGGESGGD
jgi:hypothetical protein